MKSGGRNNEGRITIRHRGGGHKRMYRLVDFNATDKLNIPATIKSIEYDPNRTAFIALVAYQDGEKRYILCHQGAKVGDQLMTAEKAPIRAGNRMQIKNIPTAYHVFNLEITPKKGGQMIKTAGSYATLLSLDGEHAQVQMPSGEVRFIEKEAYATIGEVSNQDHSLIRIGKAGRTRWLGRKPEVLGKSMNPVDHPHGGGEGHCPIGMKAPKTPWGAKALGVKTRSRTKWTNRMISSSRHHKRNAA